MNKTYIVKMLDYEGFSICDDWEMENKVKAMEFIRHRIKDKEYLADGLYTIQLFCNGICVYDVFA